MEEDLRRSKEAGFVEHIVKPIDPRQLEKAIRQALASQVELHRTHKQVLAEAGKEPG